MGDHSLCGIRGGGGYDMSSECREESTDTNTMVSRKETPFRKFTETKEKK